MHDYSFYRQLLAPNGRLLQEGDILKQTQLADTLEQIGEHGIAYFYNSTFTERMVEELQMDWNSIITVEDFQNYSSVERTVVRANYKGLEMLGMPPPSAGGPVLGHILNILDSMKLHDIVNVPVLNAFKACHQVLPRLID